MELLSCYIIHIFHRSIQRILKIIWPNVLHFLLFESYHREILLNSKKIQKNYLRMKKRFPSFILWIKDHLKIYKIHLTFSSILKWRISHLQILFSKNNPSKIIEIRKLSSNLSLKVIISRSPMITATRSTKFKKEKKSSPSKLLRTLLISETIFQIFPILIFKYHEQSHQWSTKFEKREIIALLTHRSPPKDLQKSSG